MAPRTTTTLARRRRGGVRVWLVAAAAILLFVGANTAVGIYVDLLWFSALGYESVYTTVLLSRAALFLGGGLLFLLLYLANLALTRRLRPHPASEPSRGPDDIWSYLDTLNSRMGAGHFLREAVSAALLLAGLALALVVGAATSGQWETLLRFVHQHPFGVVEPAFGMDASFYVFTLPLLRAAHGWAVGLVVALLAAALVSYATAPLGASRGRPGDLAQAARQLGGGARTHLLILTALVLVGIAVAHWLEVYGLVQGARGVVYGAGYADTVARAPALRASAAAALLAALLLIAGGLGRRPRLALAGPALWLAVWLLGANLYPALVQGTEVRPNELTRERPYLEANIRLTLVAYGLDRVAEQFFPAEDVVTAEALRNSPETVQNIRLWDPRPLLDTFDQLQTIRSYYDFVDVDVDRYTIEGQYRQVMLAARELAPERLTTLGQSWINQRLQFTHGYGVAMAPVNEVAEEGRPDFLLRDVPPAGVLPLTRPEIYYGERTSGYVIVGTAVPEFDYPRGDENVYTRYAGGGGIALDSPLRKAAFAWYLRDLNLLLSNELGPGAQLLMRRRISDRVGRLAPFLLYDRDPYIVVADGRLRWIQDGFTTSNDFPYSQPFGGRFNYIRNSVKAVIDAYDGSVAFYVVDANDPLVATYAAIFPGLFRPAAEIPAELRGHLRYPEDLFDVQVEIYRTYHMQDPTVFYNREDVWAVPTELFGETAQPVEPYYVTMRLPGAASAEFLMMQPLVPSGRDNMIAWFAARNDVPHYGELLVYKYPKEKLVYGPLQIEARIDQDPTISAQLTLWGQRGSRVIRGNLLVIPIGNANLYVEPIYLQAENGQLPELKRVVVASGSRVAMEERLDAALARLVGSPPTAGGGTETSTGPVAGDVAALAQAAADHLERARQALREGDWARYGEEQRALEETIQQLLAATQAAP